MKNPQRFKEACQQVHMVPGFLDGLREELDDYRTRLVTVRDADELRTLQGRAQELKRIIDLIGGNAG
jgi:hypothetical protein